MIIHTCHEVLHKQISFCVFGESTYSCLDAKLDGSHEGVGLDLLVGDHPSLVDPPVADLPVTFTDRTVLGVTGSVPSPPSVSEVLRPTIIEGAVLVL